MISAPRRSPGASLFMAGIACAASIAIAAWGAPDVQAQQQRQVFVSIVDGRGLPVMDLQPDEFAVTENGAACRLVKLEPIEWPMQLTVLVDNGTPSASYLSSLRTGLQGLFEQIPDGIEVSLLSLAPQPRWIVRPTTEPVKAVKGVDLIAPDAQVAKFFDGLSEAGTRIDKEKTKTFPVIVLVVSDVASSAVPLENELQRLQKQIQSHAVTVHVVVLSTGARANGAPGGYLQRQLGQAMANLSGGRFEQITSATRLTTLLPELGVQIAKSQVVQGHQYRITYEPPSGADPKAPTSVSVNVGRPTTRLSLSLDGHRP